MLFDNAVSHYFFFDSTIMPRIRSAIAMIVPSIAGRTHPIIKFLGVPSLIPRVIAQLPQTNIPMTKEAIIYSIPPTILI